MRSASRLGAKKVGYAHIGRHKSHRVTLGARAVTLCGYLTRPMPAKQPTIEKVPVPCDRCHGTGINAGIECSECGGKGHRVVIGGRVAAPTKPPERRKRWRGKPPNRR